MARTTITVNRITASATAIEDSSLTTGTRFFVHSSGTNTATRGLTPDDPLATLAYAISLCTANKNDTIYLMPGHAETITTAGGVTTSIAGITIIGLGNGSNRATYTFASSTAATWLISAINVTVKNVRFVNDIDSLVTFINISGVGNFTMDNCEFVTSSGKEAICFVLIPTTYDDFTFKGCKFYQPTDPAGSDGAAGTGCFYFVDSENLFFEDCFFYGNFETAIWHNKTTAAKNVWVRRCYGTQLLTGAEVFTQVAAMEGGVTGGCLFIIPGADDVTEAKTWGTLSDKFFINLDCGVGNDGANGQLAVAGATAAS